MRKHQFAFNNGTITPLYITKRTVQRALVILKERGLVQRESCDDGVYMLA